MGLSYIPYAITEGYCFVLALTILFSLNSNLGSEHEVQQLRNMIYSFLVMQVTDILWALMEGNTIRLPLLLNAVINALVIISVSCGCYFWFRFIEDRTHFSLLSKKKLDSLVSLPLFIIIALDLISIFTGWMFYINGEGHFENGPWFDLQSLVNYTYLIILTVISANRALHAHLKQEKSEYWTYTLYMLVPLTASIFEETFANVPLLSLNILMMILILFLKIQNLRISTDALTGLNNRRRLNIFLDEKLSRVSEEQPLLLLMIDINDFKSINDKYGHIEGDHALQLFSEVMRAAASKYFAFAARYGGDEFCLVMNPPAGSPEDVVQEIKETLAEKQKSSSETKQYEVSVSIGYTICSQSGEAPESVLNRADRLLYEEKDKWHLRGR